MVSCHAPDLRYREGPALAAWTAVIDALPLGNGFEFLVASGANGHKEISRKEMFEASL